MTIPSELKDAIVLYSNGSAVKDIAEDMGITKRALYCRINRAGIVLSELDVNVPCIECGKEFVKAKNHQLRCPECQQAFLEKEIIARYVNGSPIGEIAKDNGITRKALYERMSRAGIVLSELDVNVRCVECGEEFVKGRNRLFNQIRCAECQAVRSRMIRLECHRRFRRRERRYNKGYHQGYYRGSLRTLHELKTILNYVHACVECGGKTMLATENEYYSASEMCCTSCGLVEGG